jgi:hypothetical protein
MTTPFSKYLFDESSLNKSECAKHICATAAEHIGRGCSCGDSGRQGALRLQLLLVMCNGRCRRHHSATSRCAPEDDKSTGWWVQARSTKYVAVETDVISADVVCCGGNGVVEIIVIHLVVDHQLIGPLLLATFGGGHFGGVFLAPFGASVLKPDLEHVRNNNIN